MSLTVIQAPAAVNESESVSPSTARSPASVSPRGSTVGHHSRGGSWSSSLAASTVTAPQPPHVSLA